MANRLPEGLITTSSEIGQNLRRAERIDAETLRRMWHVFNVNSRFLQDGTVRRMENMFWRIWSNKNIHTSITPGNVAWIAEGMARNENRVSFPPTENTASQATPSVTAQGGSESTTTSESQQPVSSPEATPTNASTKVTAESQVTQLSAESTHHLPPPILKKSTTSSEEHPRLGRAKLSSEQSRDVSPLSPKTRHSSSSREPPSPRTANRSPGPTMSRKKSGLIAGTSTKPKTRPGMSRRKSSQGSVSLAKKSPAVSPRIRPSRGEGESSVSRTRGGLLGQPARFSLGAPEISPSDAASTFALPSTSWQDIDSPPHSQVPGNTAFTQPSSWLVDKDFRSKFAEQKRRVASHNNLANLGKSSVRFLEELPERSRGKQRYSEVDTQGNLIRSQLHSFTSEADEKTEEDDQDIAIDDGDDSPSILPKTKSQLSLLIDHERRSSGKFDIYPQLKADAGNESVEETRPTDDNEDEDDCLAMKTNNRSKGKGKNKANEMSFMEEEEFRSPTSEATW